MASDKDKAKDEERESAARQYGWSMSLIESDPELKKIFKKAVKQGYDSGRFVAEVMDTKWFKKHQASWRTNEALRLTDPAEYNARLKAAEANLRDNAAQMGTDISDKQLKKIAQNSMAFGWDAAQQRDAMAQYISRADSGDLKGQYVGQAGKDQAALKAIARANGYQIPKGRMSDWLKSIAAGDASVADYQKMMQRQAAAAFPSFADELAAGADLADLANPYMQRMASILEIPESKVDLFDPTIRKALASKDPQTGKPTAVPIYEFEDQLRADPRWAFTDNAHSQILGLGNKVLQSMGVGGF